MALRSVEGQIEEFVEGLVARAFRSGLQPVEIGRRLRRVVLNDRRVNVKGVVTVANHFTVELSQEDHERLVLQGPSLQRDLVDELRTVVQRESLTFAGPVSVEFTANDDRRLGTFSIERRFEDGPAVPDAELLLTDGRSVALPAAGLRIGRHPDNDVVIDEQNVSRFHAELVPRNGEWLILDNRSTNGTTLNGKRLAGDQSTLSQGTLSDGDVVVVGPASLTFRYR